MADSTRISRLGQVSMPVRDLERAVVFYRDTLGLGLLFQVPRMAFFDCGDTRLLLAEPEHDEPTPSGSILYFRVDEIERETEVLRGRGVEILSEPHLVATLTDHDLWMSFFRDPDGNTLALMSETRMEG